MAILRLGDYCCQAGDKQIDTEAFSSDDLILAREDRNSLMFAPLGNQPQNPVLALVGITPGSQSEIFATLLRTHTVEDAAKKAAFAKGQDAITGLLNAHGFAEQMGITLDGDLNDNPKIYTTSLVKCCLKVEGNYQYKAPDIEASPHARFCVQNRFLADMAKYPSLRWVVIFGDEGWEAVTGLRHQGVTLKEHLESRDLKVVNFPHFAQNFQQRALFSLDPSVDASYLRNNPKHQPYAAKAHALRSTLLNTLGRDTMANQTNHTSTTTTHNVHPTVSADRLSSKKAPKRLSDDDRFSNMFLIHSSGDKLHPVRMKNRDTGRAAFRLSLGGAGGNTKEMSIEIEDEQTMKQYVIERGYAVRASTRTGSRPGLYKLGMRSISRYGEK